MLRRSHWRIEGRCWHGRNVASARSDRASPLPNAKALAGPCAREPAPTPISRLPSPISHLPSPIYHAIAYASRLGSAPVILAPDVNHDHLRAAEIGARFLHLDRVPASRQARAHRLADPGFHAQSRATKHAPPRRPHRLLRRHAEAEYVVQDLDRCLRLSVPARSAERHCQRAVGIQRHGRGQRVERALPGAMTLGCSGARSNSDPRLCSTIPVPSTIRPLPNGANRLWIIDTAFPSLSTTLQIDRVPVPVADGFGGLRRHYRVRANSAASAFAYSFESNFSTGTGELGRQVSIAVGVRRLRSSPARGFAPPSCAPPPQVWATSARFSSCRNVIPCEFGGNARIVFRVRDAIGTCHCERAGRDRRTSSPFAANEVGQTRAKRPRVCEGVGTALRKRTPRVAPRSLAFRSDAPRSAFGCQEHPRRTSPRSHSGAQRRYPATTGWTQGARVPRSRRGADAGGKRDRAEWLASSGADRARDRDETQDARASTCDKLALALPSRRLSSFFNFPDISTLIVCGTLNQQVPVAIAIAASVEPTPIVKAPSPPPVGECESAPRIKFPGLINRSDMIW